MDYNPTNSDYISGTVYSSAHLLQHICIEINRQALLQSASNINRMKAVLNELHRGNAKELKPRAKRLNP